VAAFAAAGIGLVVGLVSVAAAPLTPAGERAPSPRVLFDAAHAGPGDRRLVVSTSMPDPEQEKPDPSGG
jgi:hypothetical protein